MREHISGLENSYPSCFKYSTSTILTRQVAYNNTCLICRIKSVRLKQSAEEKCLYGYADSFVLKRCVAGKAETESVPTCPSALPANIVTSKVCPPCPIHCPAAIQIDPGTLVHRKALLQAVLLSPSPL